MSKLLALDQASITSGWSVWDNGKLVQWGHFTVPSSSEMGHRLNTIKKNINNLIQQYNIDEVAFEDIQMQANVINNVRTYKALAEVIGVLESYLDEKKIKYTIVHSQVWKSGLEIKGKNRPEQKRNAQLFVEKTYNIKATQDECDSICIGTYMNNKENDLNWE